ncbi:baseplate J/gp47 family protein [Paenibacillus sp. BK720]|uniref:baseplate J/gp47 family protein n=1 Tax=Paenibacillus sp. BK720 TaxID=2587092 RepID=UPI0014208EEF|nr:baseplate J/gp47 family protein [Paenibacillus sp. BK720]NIK67943.1 putative phage protein gp47/JayE [Paenibacillus sp. BK720]
MADRKTFIPVYEETEDAILARIIGHSAMATWRKEPGDFIYDAVAPDAREILQLQIGMDAVLQSAHAQYAEGDALDEILSDAGLTRLPATPNQRALQITADAGVVIPLGQTFTALILDVNGNPLQYTLDKALSFSTAGLTLTANLTCTTAGAIGNLATGSQFILTPTIPGVRVIVDAGTTIAGGDRETDDEAFKRYDFKVNNPDTGGNKSDLKRWAEEVTGVGAARVIPRWNGNLTTKIVIAGADFTPGSTQLVADVQNHMDPGITGLGEGKAPAGNRVTVVSATALSITVTATVSYFAGVSAADVKVAFTVALKDYLEKIVFSDMPVSIAKIGSLLISTEGVANYSNLKLNNGTADIPVGTEQIAVVGAVTI